MTLVHLPTKRLRGDRVYLTCLINSRPQLVISCLRHVTDQSYEISGRWGGERGLGRKPGEIDPYLTRVIAHKRVNRPSRGARLLPGDSDDHIAPPLAILCLVSRTVVLLQ